MRTFPHLVTVLSLGLAACGDPPTTAPADCVTDEAFFAAQAAPLLSAQCVTCHVEGGLAGGTRHVLVPFVDDAALAENMARLGALVRDTDDGAALLLQKPTGQVPHVGGARFDTLSPEYAVLHELVARLGEPGACEHPGEAPPTCEDGVIYPASAPLRRLTDAQVRHSIMDLVGVELPDGLFPATTSGPEFRTFANNNTVTSAGVEGVMLAAEHVSANMDLDTLWACGAAEAEAPGAGDRGAPGEAPIFRDGERLSAHPEQEAAQGGDGRGVYGVDILPALAVLGAVELRAVAEHKRAVAVDEPPPGVAAVADGVQRPGEPAVVAAADPP